MSDHSSGSNADSRELAQFGYEQSFERHTGKFASFAVAFAFVSIATGLFTTYGAVLNSSGPVGIWTWPSRRSARSPSPWCSACWPPASR
ncbi:hypothetical protein [Aeromicrobium wangtongii]|uniref:Amino acid permease n=1 Tax=Aeromicrobium wangtongii TaxID=2969247 RepID=A0ABY5MCQ0_9ACTN|nr:hypothetical protein [Aeromicrobium wangtongii]MCD9196937.1 hypothetical protein [Aeromicrobium wangtongii]UUP14443.1 hypothetical protein NQV15_03765 [Aeromicrobium wangtongii]